MVRSRLSQAQQRGHKRRVKKLRKGNKDFFKEIGSIGGNESTTWFDSDSGRAAANRRWEEERKKLRKEKQNGQFEEY